MIIVVFSQRHCALLNDVTVGAVVRHYFVLVSASSITTVSRRLRILQNVRFSFLFFPHVFFSF